MSKTKRKIFQKMKIMMRKILKYYLLQSIFHHSLEKIGSNLFFFILRELIPNV